MALHWFACCTAAFTLPHMHFTQPHMHHHAAARPLAFSPVMVFDVNSAVTRLNAAIAKEDYLLASKIRDEIAAGRSDESAEPLTWPEDTPNWLQTRLEDLGYRYPTPVQAGALQARSSEERDAVISAPTGAGKTLGFAVPLLVTASDELEKRGEAAVAAVSDLLDAPIERLSPTDAMAALSPALLLPGRDGSEDIPLPSRGPPIGLVVAPTASLADQASRVLFSLCGGYARESRTYGALKIQTSPATPSSATVPTHLPPPRPPVPGAQDSLFKFDGPKAIRIAAIMTADDGRAAAEAAADGSGPLRDCEVLVATPMALAAYGHWRIEPHPSYAWPSPLSSDVCFCAA